ncbi:Nif3-like dinuclear metal center hexameric protein [Desulfopila sp. IMCC35006]|uniref:Nif3-like dinuclear metal center hexameric protein n=1 Tax=Desulfopila sp. IMCC35006 TaxID=2569542 RepID=UPI0010AB9CF6|nr:Nif3-like dinuclear metal center hexameric protein [Desulfopila sp. IMCC35006]TKB26081.1 Nif3-like dinuclear metal center hexameric protein [Desulfopila sp. IMCC35006]
MPVQVKDIVESLNQEAPFSLAEAWDNVGLLVGDPDQEVTAVLAGLDPTNRLVEEAIALGANTIITHHPVIFKPLPNINTAEPGGRLLQKALAGQIALIGCHTNFDSAREGVSDYLALQLGLINLSPLVCSPGDNASGTGLGRIGSYSSPLAAVDFVARMLRVLNLPSVQMAGTLPAKITTVAICGGSGSDLAPLAFQRGADVYLSAEIKHSTALWAVENNFCIIDGTHYATEKPAVALLVKKLQEAGEQKNWNIRILQTQDEHPPFVLLDKTYNPQ